ncbi:MAG: hypothetical protein L3J91_05285, partial [Thermoplasmata archaeon]|nr:hypothetical protein [Thermoplasmata archaeon]
MFRLGLPGVALSRDRFAGSGFTRVLYDGADYVPYATAADMAHELVRLLDGERPPRLIYTYWDELDTIQHLRGPTPELTAFELDRLAHFVAYVRHQLSPSRRKSTSVMI